MIRRSLQFLKFSLAGCFALGFAQSARAQTFSGQGTPKVEVFGGYSYLRADTIGSGQTLNLNGGSGSLAYDFNKFVGVVADLGFYHQGNVTANGLSLNLWSYQLGPRFTLRNHRHLTPFAQVLLGAGHAGGTLYTSSLGNGQPPLGPNYALLVTAGVGVDWRLNPTVGIRLIQAEYLYSQFRNGTPNDDRQNNVRLSAGVVFSFGRR